MKYISRFSNWEQRQKNVVHRVTRPSRIEKARSLGYKAKQGFVVYSVRVRRGDRKKKVPKGIVWGKTTNAGINKQKSANSLQALAERRVARRLASNLRILNSYRVGQDAVY